MCLDEKSCMRSFICSQFVQIGDHGQNSDVSKKFESSTLHTIITTLANDLENQFTSVKSSTLRKQRRGWLGKSSELCHLNTQGNNLRATSSN